MEIDEPKIPNDPPHSEKAVTDFIEEQKVRMAALVPKRPKKTKGNTGARGTNRGRNLFQKGNKIGVRFGYGQPTDRGGMPKKDTTVLKEMKSAAETYGLAANDIARAMVKLSMDENVDARFRFPFMKEANLRIFGQPKNSLEDTLKHINDKVDKLYELTMPLLEATAVGDGVALVRELMSQGKLDQVVKQIEGEKA